MLPRVCRKNPDFPHRFRAMGPKMKCATLIFICALSIIVVTVGVCHLTWQLAQTDPMHQLDGHDRAVSNATNPDWVVVVSSIRRLATQSALQQVLMSIAASLAVVFFFVTILVITIYPSFLVLCIVSAD